jgi:hypothetical protein
VIIIVIILAVAWRTTYQVIKADRAHYDKNFYEANSQARLEKAHFVFYHLYNDGLQARYGTPE